MVFLEIAICIVVFLVLVCEVYTLATGVPTVTSWPSVRKKMVERLSLESAAHKGSEPFTILDLGSGTGKLALEIGRALPNARVAGLEISIVPYGLSQLRRVLWRAKNVRFMRKDFWGYKVSSYDAVVIFINEHIRDKMAAKLAAELHEGALVISNETHLPGWTPIETHKVGLMKVQMVVYRRL